MRTSFLLNAFAVSTAIVSAQQTPAQIAAELPSCVDACDSAAIATVGCGETDYACHCAHSDQIKALLLPCLQKSSNCTSAELQTFATLVPEICVALNNTGNATTVSPTGSSSPTTSSTLVPFTGEAARLTRLSGGVVGLLGVAFLAWML